MTRWAIYAYISEIVEADDQFEAEQKGLAMLERDGIRAEEIEDETEPTQ